MNNFFGIPYNCYTNLNQDELVGLKYVPKFFQEQLNEEDCLYQGSPHYNVVFGEYGPGSNMTIPHFDTDTTKAFTSEFLTIADTAKLIVEIGVDAGYNQESPSSTKILLDNKKPDTIYLGIDLDDKSYLNNVEQNIYTIKTTSFNTNDTFAQIEQFGGKIDFLFIDGWHSVNAMINDWKYVKYLSVGGIVAMHDSHWHPGPVMVFDAIDDEIFEKKSLFTDRPNWGIAFARRLK